LLLATAIFFKSDCEDRVTDQGPLPGEKLPTFIYQDKNGRDFHSGELLGRKKYIAFIDLRCLSCQKRIKRMFHYPEFQQEENVEIILISVNYSDSYYEWLGSELQALPVFFLVEYEGLSKGKRIQTPLIMFVNESNIIEYSTLGFHNLNKEIDQLRNFIHLEMEPDHHIGFYSERSEFLGKDGVELQVNRYDCGIAVIKNALKMLGKGEVLQSYNFWRKITVTGKGISMTNLAGAIRSLGIPCKVKNLKFVPLSRLKTPAILHLNSNHYILLYSSIKDHLLIIDPAIGKIRTDIDSVQNLWSGNCILLDAKYKN